MSARDENPEVGEVLSAVGEAARELTAYASNAVRDQPGVALVAALAAGFIAGGGLVSPLGVRIAAGTLRATVGNLTTLIALDVIRRTVEGGGHGASFRGHPSV